MNDIDKIIYANLAKYDGNFSITSKFFDKICNNIPCIKCPFHPAGNCVEKLKNFRPQAIALIRKEKLEKLLS